MVRLHHFLLGAILGAASLSAQSPVPAGEVEKGELAAAVQEANTSGFDMIRALEDHLRKYPNTSLLPEIQKLLANSAIEVKDTERIAKYGVPALDVTPNDALLLDRVAAALLTLGGRENAEKALGFAKRFEDYVTKIPVAGGSDPARNQEDHDRALGRALLYQARAEGVLGMNDDARKKAQLSYMAYADETSAHEWAVALERAGNHEDAIRRMADAFSIPDPRATDETRAADRVKLGEMYRAIHNGSEAGLGDEILAAYDRTSKDVEKRRAELRKLDPNTGKTDAGAFTLAGLEGGKLELTSLRGKVLILDFWATWCVPCRTQHPLYEDVKKRFADRNDVMFISVNSDDDHEDVAPFIAEQKWSRNVYFDSGLARLLSVNSIPSTIVLDKQGRMASRMDGFYPDRFVDQLSARIRTILGPEAAQAK